MKTLIISGSARSDGNTSLVLNELTLENYNRIELSEKSISHYKYNETTFDDFKEISELLLEVDLIIFATPVYWYSMSGHLKVFFDRMTELVKMEKEKGRQLKNKKVYLISTSASPQEPNEFELPFRETAKYLDMVYIGFQHFYFPKDLILTEESAERIEKLNNLLNTEISV